MFLTRTTTIILQRRNTEKMISLSRLESLILLLRSSLQIRFFARPTYHHHRRITKTTTIVVVDVEVPFMLKKNIRSCGYWNLQVMLSAVITHLPFSHAFFDIFPRQKVTNRSSSPTETTKTTS